MDGVIQILAESIAAMRWWSTRLRRHGTYRRSYRCCSGRAVGILLSSVVDLKSLECGRLYHRSLKSPPGRPSHNHFLRSPQPLPRRQRVKERKREREREREKRTLVPTCTAEEKQHVSLSQPYQDSRSADDVSRCRDGGQKVDARGVVVGG